MNVTLHRRSLRLIAALLTLAALTACGAVPPAAGFVNGAGSIDDTVRVRPRTKRGSHMLHMLRRMGMLRRA